MNVESITEQVTLVLLFVAPDGIWRLAEANVPVGELGKTSIPLCLSSAL